MTNRYLHGPFAPLHQEYTLTDLEVAGTIPDHLNGRYLRNGSNPIGEIDPDFYHWFIGDGMVRGIRIRDGKAEWYRNRWVRAPSASKALGERSRDGQLWLLLDWCQHQCDWTCRQDPCIDRSRHCLLRTHR
jgi:carotenoid cleavage oxygenase